MSGQAATCSCLPEAGEPCAVCVRRLDALLLAYTTQISRRRDAAASFAQLVSACDRWTNHEAPWRLAFLQLQELGTDAYRTTILDAAYYAQLELVALLAAQQPAPADAVEEPSVDRVQYLTVLRTLDVLLRKQPTTLADLRKIVAREIERLTAQPKNG